MFSAVFCVRNSCNRPVLFSIAARLKRSAAAIYEELKRGYTGEFDGYARPKYSADLAQATVQENFRRRGNRRGANC